MVDTSRLVQQVLTAREQRQAEVDDAKAHQRRVRAALHTLATHPEVAPAWSLFLGDLVATTLLKVVMPGDNMQEHMLMHEGKRQLVLQLLLALQEPVEG